MNKNHGVFGLSRQGASAPAVSFPASTSSPGIDAGVSNEPVKLTNGKRDTTVGRYVTGVESSASVTTLAFADALGLMLYGALGADEVTGSGPYTHDFKIGEALPELAFYQQVGASDAALQKLSGAKVSKLGISAEGVAPPSVELELQGAAAEWLPATAWNGPAFDPEDGWFTSAGAEVLIALTGSAPGAVPAYMSLNGLTAEVSSEMTPMRRFGSAEAELQQEGSATVTCSLSGTTSDTQIYRTVKTGSASGTAIAPTILTGSLQVTFPHTKQVGWSLVLKFPAIPWSCDALSVDVEGGPFDLTLSTDGAIALDGTSIEVLLVNDVASYA